MDQKLEYLEDANKFLSKSINADSDGNWFAYTTRMYLSLDIADIVKFRSIVTYARKFSKLLAYFGKHRDISSGIF
jgi:hypothetical protein